MKWYWDKKSLIIAVVIIIIIHIVLLVLSICRDIRIGWGILV